MKKSLHQSNINRNASKEDVQVPSILPPLISADLTTITVDADEDNTNDKKEPQKVTDTQMSFKMPQKPCYSDVVEAKAETEEQAVNNTHDIVTTNSETKVKCERFAKDNEGPDLIPGIVFEGKGASVHLNNSGGPELLPVTYPPNQKSNKSGTNRVMAEEKSKRKTSNGTTRIESVALKSNTKGDNTFLDLEYSAKSGVRWERFAEDNEGPDLIPESIFEGKGASVHLNNSEETELLPVESGPPNQKSNKSGANLVIAKAKAKSNRKTSNGTTRIGSVALTSKTRDDKTVFDLEDPTEIDFESEDSLHSNEAVRRPGAFAISGIGGGGGSNTWASNYLDTAKDEDSIVEAAPAHIAEVIDDESLHITMRESVIMETVQADVVVNDDKEKAKQTKCIFCWAFSLATVLGLVIGLSIGLTGRDGSPAKETPNIFPTVTPTYNPLPTLEIIKGNDVVRCGIGWIKPLEEDLCRALAAAVLGDPQKIEIFDITFDERWQFLLDHSLDVVTLLSTHTMQRDIFESKSRVGFSFSTPFTYDGGALGGIPNFVDCADRLDTYFEHCKDVRICVAEGGTAEDFFKNHVADFNIRTVMQSDLYNMFVQGKCNVIAGYAFGNSESILRQMNYTGQYKMGKTVFTKYPECITTREDDREWSDFVDWVTKALLAAEEKGITSATASNFTTTTVFGEEYQNMFVNAIQAVGNYGDLYKKHLEHIVPRESFGGVNSLNNGNTGLQYPFPLAISSHASDPVEGSTLYTVTAEQGQLRCGIYERAGFGELVFDKSRNLMRWQGMDADYCYALSASLFQGDANRVNFIKVTSNEEAYQALDSGRVDVLAGGHITLEDDVKEATTGKGYTFSFPYFYDVDEIQNENEVDMYKRGETVKAIAMVTREDDPQWSDFVSWIVSAIVMAEEEFTTKATSEDMLGVSGFGPQFVDMFRDAVGAVGNYGEIYDRSVQSIVPREGRNLLNTNPYGPQQFSFF